MTIKDHCKTYWEDFKAWRRGEVRVAPRGTTGRIYARKDGLESSPSSMESKTQGDCIIRARVYRAATGIWEDLGTISIGSVKKV